MKIIRIVCIFLLLCGAASAQTYFTDCAGITGTALAGTVTCPNLPLGVNTALNYQAVVPHAFPAQGQAPGSCIAGNHCYPATAGNSSSLQTQITNAAADCNATGSWVVVPSGNTYTTTTTYNLPATNCDSTHWVIIQSDHLSSLAGQGTRISASANNMPILGTSTFSNSVINIEDRPSGTPSRGYWLAGLDIEDDPSSTRQPALLILGDGCADDADVTCVNEGSGNFGLPSSTTISQLTSRITIDRCWIHPTQPTSNVHFGIRFTASQLAVEDSIIESHDTGVSPGQPQAFSSDYSFGLIDIGNNEIMAPTENILFGGGPHVPANDTTSDIYIHQNYIHKRTSWMDAGGANYFQPLMRNFIECKNCARMLIEGNVFDTDAGNSVSAAIQFTPRDSSAIAASDPCLWCTVTDVTVRYNKFSNISDWFTVIGANCGESPSCTAPPSLPAKRFNVHDNVVENLNQATYGGNGRWVYLSVQSATATDCSGTPNTAPCQLSDIIVTHNSGVGDQTHSNTILTVDAITNPPASTSKGFNIVVTNNIFPAGVNGFNINSVSEHPMSTALSAFFSSYTFDNNVLTNLTSVGLTTADFPSPICNFSADTGHSCSGSNPGWQTAMSGVGFVNYNSGSGGDYHVCASSTAPTGCSAASPYIDMATDSLLDNTKDGLPPGANIDAVNELAFGVTTGTYTIQPVRQVPQVMGQNKEMRTCLIYPKYFDTCVADGSGKADFSGYNSGGDAEGWSGAYIFHDRQHDPGALYNLGGFNVGLTDNDYVSNDSLGCGIGNNIQDTKAFWGQVFVRESNNVRTVIEYEGPLIKAGSPSTVLNSSVFWHFKYYIYRPGKWYVRESWDNSSGCAITFNHANGSLYQYVISNSLSTWQGQPPNSLSQKLSQYPPSYGFGYGESWFGSNPCHGNGVSNDICVGYPFGFDCISDSATCSVGIQIDPGMIYHSTASAFSDSLASMSVGVTDGYTNPYGVTSVHEPITAEFLLLLDEDSACAFWPYKAQPNGNGMRSKCQIDGSSTPSFSIPNSGTDSNVRHVLGLFGDLGIKGNTNALIYQTEYLSPPSPTVNAGSGVSFNYDDGAWHATASGTPSLDITTTGTMHSPAFLISGWNNSVPNVSVGGVTQTANVGFVYANTDSSHILVQLVNLPSAGNGGMTTLPASTRVIISASGVPSAFGVQRSGTTYQRGTAIIH